MKGATVRKEYGIKLDVLSFDMGVRLLIEQLRYADIVSNQEGEREFTIWAPREARGQVWQERNIARMKSFGIKGEPVERNW